MYIPRASEIWDNQKNKGAYEKSAASVIRDIQRASEAGRRQTCFNPYDYTHYDAVKREFESRGYYFTPTGYIGGVWQRTENITW